MLSVAKLKRRPNAFRAFTGVTVNEFDKILEQLTPAYEQAEHDRKNRPQRQRKIGAGRHNNLALPERFLMGLVYLRLYISQSLLAFLFDLDASNISREFNQRLFPLLLEILPVPLRDAPLRQFVQTSGQDSSEPGTKRTPTGGGYPVGDSGKKRTKPRPRINTLEELLRTYPDLAEILIDATEQPIPQPQDKQKRKQAYSGKQQDHTVKTQIVATKSQILHVFGALPGCLHDATVLKASGVMHCVPSGVKVRLDKGYEGTDACHPRVAVQQPIKGKRHHKVTALGRAYNYMLSVLRIPVEHHFSRLKKFGCQSQVFRGSLSSHEDLFCLVSGLLNYRASGQFSLV
jgi:hypothetical protein